MIRSIIGFHRGHDSVWVAELSCHHTQHVRHRPPFQDRAWVLDPAGRDDHIGSSIDCPLCERLEIPEGLTIIGRAGPWDQDSLPAGLRRAHRTAEGRWGRLRVLEGAADFQFEGSEPPAVVHLAAGSRQLIPPSTPHRVVLTGPVRLDLEFWGRP